MPNEWKIVGFGLIILIIAIISPILYSEILDSNNLSIIIVGILTGFFVSIISAIVFTRYQFFLAFNRLCREVDDNHTRTLPESINHQFILMREKARQEPRDWIGFEKVISVFVLTFSEKSLGHDQYRYLSSNEFKTFVIQGHYINLPQNIIHSLTLFYFYCDAFSIEEQNCEKSLNHTVKWTNPERIIEETENTIRCISEKYAGYRHHFETLYPDISDTFQMISLFDIEKWLFF